MAQRLCDHFWSHNIAHRTDKTRGYPGCFGCRVRLRKRKLELSWYYNRFVPKIVVRVSAGESLLIELKGGFSECQYRYDKIPKSYTDIEFWNPIFDVADLEGLEYVKGLDDEGRIICARNRGCKFLIKT
ncbi:conjugative transfer protein MobI(A/C) [uncultured Sulfitobacter sp.]|uniref:conjugative transfer protein MobI(A/C) n=1 Tax=Marinobacter sp. ST-43 TaxID=3050453 RepID=UPI0032B12096